MENKLSLFFSNRVESLFEELKCTLGFSSRPFVRRMLVVPSMAWKSWLMLQFANDPQWGIAAGLDVMTLDQAVMSLCQQLGLPLLKPAQTPYYPTRMELALLFESNIKQAISKDEAHQLWQPLQNYLQQGDQQCCSLCVELAEIFWQYAEYGGALLDRWQEGDFNCWQGSLWYKLKLNHPQLCFPYQVARHLTAKLQTSHMGALAANLEVHLFAYSFLPAAVHCLLETLSSQAPVNYYLLSPCQLFWSDLCSDKEAARLQRFWQHKRVALDQQQALDEFLRQRNSLLANFGRMGREMATQVENCESEVFENYVLPSALSKYQQYEELYAHHLINADPMATGTKEEIGKLSLLEALQADIALLRTPLSSCPIDFPPSDHSIQLHNAPTKYREIEIVHTLLQQLLTLHAQDPQPLTPSDIIVMAPDIGIYEPYINAIFNASESILPAHLVNNDPLAKSPFVQGFMHLLTLANSRWEKSTVLGLLDFSAFRNKYRLSGSDIQQIEMWASQCSINWGYSAEHRADLLQKYYSEHTLVDNNPAGTWRHMFERLLMGLAVEPLGLQRNMPDFAVPFAGVDASSAELVGRWVAILAALESDLKPLADGSHKTLQQWACYLETLLDNHFSTSLGDSEEEAHKSSLLGYFRTLGAAEKLVGNHLYAFTSIKVHLEKTLYAGKHSHQTSKLDSVQCGSLFSLHALPSKVIVLIGMQEGSLPRGDENYALNIMRGQNICDYCPNATDCDRFWFLESLLSARQYLISSYVGYSQEEDRPQNPSLLLQELMHYLDEGYTCGGKKPSQHCVHKHSFDPFASYYFEPSDSLVAGSSYNPLHYKMAVVHHNQSKKPKCPFISLGSPVHEHNKTEDHSPIIVDVAELGSIAANPIKTYFNKTLQMYLPEANDFTEHEPFVLDSLDKHHLFTQAIRKPLGEIVDKATKVGVMPGGLFRDLALIGINNEVERLHVNMSALGVNPQAITALYFAEHHHEVTCCENGVWLLPALQLESCQGRPVTIVGWLREVTSLGLLIQKNCDFKHLLKVWPQYLILCYAIERHALPIAPAVVSLKQAKAIEQPFSKASLPYLQHYLDYYFAALQAPSPLIPEWAAELVKPEPDDFIRVVKNSLESEFIPFYNIYAKWLLRDVNHATDLKSWHASWHPWARVCIL